MTCYVQFVETATEKVTHQIECPNERSAERVLRGADINLNHETYHLKISETKSADCEACK